MQSWLSYDFTHYYFRESTTSSQDWTIDFLGLPAEPSSGARRAGAMKSRS